MKLCFLRQSWRKGCRQIHEIKQCRFLMECFTAGFLRFFTVKIWLLGRRLGTCHQIQAFPKILSLSSSTTCEQP